jgi:hypothetical protein
MVGKFQDVVREKRTSYAIIYLGKPTPFRQAYTIPIDPRPKGRYNEVAPIGKDGQ